MQHFVNRFSMKNSSCDDFYSTSYFLLIIRWLKILYKFGFLHLFLESPIYFIWEPHISHSRGERSDADDYHILPPKSDTVLVKWYSPTKELKGLSAKSFYVRSVFFIKRSVFH